MNDVSILPHLWFDKDATAAVKFYCALFPESEQHFHALIPGQDGNVDVLGFTLWGCRMMAINAGTEYRFNNAFSNYVYCGTQAETDRIYTELMKGGQALMPLGKYPWNDHYAWVIDRYGLSWQLDSDPINNKQKIVPTLLFSGEQFTKVSEAARYYTSTFKNTRILFEAPFPGVNPSGALLFCQFMLNGFIVNAMSSPEDHGFSFNEAYSLMVYCNTQTEIDYFWDRLTDGGHEQACGWLRDRFGVSWQVVPSQLEDMMTSQDAGAVARLAEAMLRMGKLDTGILMNAFRGEH